MIITGTRLPVSDFSHWFLDANSELSAKVYFGINSIIGLFSLLLEKVTFRFSL